MKSDDLKVETVCKPTNILALLGRNLARVRIQGEGSNLDPRVAQLACILERFLLGPILKRFVANGIGE